MKTISAELQSHLDGDVTSLATCWTIIRPDGTTFYFTDHDRDLLVSGNVHKASSGYDRSAIANDASMAVDNLDIVGLLDDESITVQDLRNGLFDYSRVYVFMVNWMDLSMGVLKLRAGRLGEVVITHGGTFTAELRGMSQNLSQKIGELYTVSCRADLGDTRCGVVLSVTVDWAATTAYVLGDLVVPTERKPMTLSAPFQNLSFEDAAMTEWTAYGQSGEHGSKTEQNGTLPYVGSRFLHVSTSISGEGSYYQDWTLEELGVVVGEEIWLQGYQAQVYPDDPGELMIRCRNAANTTLAEGRSGEFVNPTLGEWVFRNTPSIIVPAGTAYIRIYCLSKKVTGTYGNHGFDGLSVLKKSATKTVPWPVYFECINAGTSEATEPVWPDTVGTEVEEAVDGVKWVSKKHHKFNGLVQGITSNKVFGTSYINDPSTFVGGILEWTSGKNLGRVCEIKNASWTEMELYLPLPYGVEVGDEFELTPGCTKMLPECRDVYDNVLNFRGEPYIPGQDAFLQYPDAK